MFGFRISEQEWTGRRKLRWKIMTEHFHILGHRDDFFLTKRVKVESQGRPSLPVSWHRSFEQNSHLTPDFCIDGERSDDEMCSVGREEVTSLGIELEPHALSIHGFIGKPKTWEEMGSRMKVKCFFGSDEDTYGERSDYEIRIPREFQHEPLQSCEDINEFLVTYLKSVTNRKSVAREAVTSLGIELVPHALFIHGFIGKPKIPEEMGSRKKISYFFGYEADTYKYAGVLEENARCRELLANGGKYIIVGRPSLPVSWHRSFEQNSHLTPDFCIDGERSDYEMCSVAREEVTSLGIELLPYALSIHGFIGIPEIWKEIGSHYLGGSYVETCQLDYGLQMKRTVQAFTGAKLKIGRATFKELCRGIASRIPENKWMRFARLHLNLTEDEIQKFRPKYCTFNKEQQRQISRFMFPGKMDTPNKMRQSEGTDFVHMSELNLADLDQTNQVFHEEEVKMGYCGTPMLKIGGGSWFHDFHEQYTGKTDMPDETEWLMPIEMKMEGSIKPNKETHEHVAKAENVSTVQQKYGVLEENARYKMLLASGRKAKLMGQMDYGIQLKRSVQAFTGAKLKIGRATFKELCRVIASLIPEYKWMRFARLHLNLTEEEIQKFRHKYCTFNEEQQRQISRFVFPGKMDTPNKMRQSEGSYFGDMSEPNLADLDQTNQVFHEQEVMGYCGAAILNIRGCSSFHDSLEQYTGKTDMPDETEWLMPIEMKMECSIEPSKETNEHVANAENVATVQQKYGVLEENARYKMLLASGRKAKLMGQMDYGLQLKRSVQAFTGAKLKIGRATFTELCYVIASRIPEDKWMRFARLHLNLTEVEIQKFRRKYCTFNEEQERQILKRAEK